MLINFAILQFCLSIQQKAIGRASENAHTYVSMHKDKVFVHIIEAAFQLRIFHRMHMYTQGNVRLNLFNFHS